MFWSFSIGQWLRTDIRVSWFFPLLILGLAFRLGPQMGLAIGLILFFSTLAHELLGHILAARLTGGEGNEVLMWPFGGLASVSPANNFFSRFMTAFAGPLVNLVICITTLPTALAMLGNGVNAFYPFALPIAGFSESLFVEFMVLTFYVNWILFLLNMVPVYPLDGGRMLESGLRLHMEEKQSRGICIRVGIGIAIVGMLVGWLWVEQLSIVMLISTFILIMNSMELIQLPFQEAYDDSFLGYDFSQGYTSLEKETQREREVKLGPIAKWKLKRQQDKEEKKRVRLEEMEQDLDTLLEKVHKSGMDSLSESEKQRLKTASLELQNRQKSN